MATAKRTSEVFGISNTVLPDSYVDRGALDEQFAELLARTCHISLRGESKCGKSWLRQCNISEALVVQCRLGKVVSDLYVDALSQLGIALELERSADDRVQGRVEARGQLGVKLLAKVGLGASLGADKQTGKKERIAGHDIGDLRFVADIIKASGKRVVIEDFHYMSVEERGRFAFDLKALWDYGLFVVIVGVWNQSNMLLYLNPDLTGRVKELSIYWSNDDLMRVLDKGGEALNLVFDVKYKQRLVRDCFNNVGILQALTLESLKEIGVRERSSELTIVDDIGTLETAAMEYADQLSPFYQQFAERVSRGIRARQDSTGIYAHAMAAILEADDQKLLNGFNLDSIFEVAHAREERIQKGNLRTVLEKFEQLQVDKHGRGLVLAYNDATGDVSVVDRQLLLYRRYLTVKWPWEDMVHEAAGESEIP